MVRAPYFAPGITWNLAAIDDAIDFAAGDHNDQISADPARRASADRKVQQARATIAAFLECLPDELTVFEVRQMLEESGRTA